jgi:hypothetical protein
MRDDPFSESLLVRYLLGDLPEEQQVEIEERAFSDHQYLRNIQAVESELIDEYVRGGLRADERRRFEERFFASAERRSKVEFSRALATVAPEFTAAGRAVLPRTAPLPGLWQHVHGAFLAALSRPARYALAAAALLVVLGSTWLIVESFRLRGQLAQLRAEQESREHEQQALQQQIADEKARRENLSGQLERERQQREHSDQLIGELQRQLEQSTTQPSQSVVSLALWPGLARGGGARPKLVLTQSARLVKVQIGIEPEDEYQSLRVELRGPTGQPVWTQGDLKGRHVRTGRSVILNLPANLLGAGQYELSLKGTAAAGTIDDIGYYYFDVVKK